MSAGRASLGDVEGSPLPSEIARLRLRIQGLSCPQFDSPVGVVEWLGAMQAQEYAVAKWSTGQRTRGLVQSTIDSALVDGSILRTHVLRPTWHFVAAADLKWLLDVTAPRVRAMMSSYDRGLELDDALYARSNDVIAAAVEGGNHRTRKELSEELARNGILVQGQRLAHVVMRAELDGIVCSGAPRATQNTYALVAERAPRARLLAADEGLAELTRRYFISHGPATVRDYRWWASLTAAEAKRGLQMVAGELESWRIGGTTFWLGTAMPPPDPPSETAHLLQAYDEYIVGYTESRSFIDVAGIAARVPGQIPFHHVIVLDGQAVARWKRTIRRNRMTIEARFLRTLTHREQVAVADAVERYARFAGVAADLKS